MKRSLTILTCALAGLAAGASAQTVSTTTIVPSTATVQASTAAVQASTAAVQPSSAAAVTPSTATAPGGDAWRPGRGPWHRDCDADVARLCPGVTNRDQVENCLRTNEKMLSAPCQRIRQQEGQRLRERRR